MADFSQTAGGQLDISHEKEMGRGGYGSVHKVQLLLFKISRLNKMGRCEILLPAR